LDVEVESGEEDSVVPVEGVAVQRWVLKALPLAEAGQEAVDVVRSSQTRRLSVQNFEALQHKGHCSAKGRVVVQKLHLSKIFAIISTNLNFKLYYILFFVIRKFYHNEVEQIQ